MVSVGTFPGHHLHSEKGKKATSSWESLLGPNVTAPEIQVDNNIPVILGLPLNAASALLFPL